jgi:uncharacterized protein with HEPN domain
MPSERTDGVLRDIQYHIELAIQFVEGLDRESFKADLRTVYAVTRCLEIISEASRPAEGPTSCDPLEADGWSRQCIPSRL